MKAGRLDRPRREYGLNLSILIYIDFIIDLINLIRQGGFGLRIIAPH